MARVKRGVQARRRHKKILKQAKGYYGARSRVYRVAIQAVIKAGQYAYRDRKARKRQFRRLWIVRINAGARANGLSYSRLIDGLTQASIDIDRKVLADLAVRDAGALGALAEEAKASLAAWSSAIACMTRRGVCPAAQNGGRARALPPFFYLCGAAFAPSLAACRIDALFKP